VDGPLSGTLAYTFSTKPHDPLTTHAYYGYRWYTADTGRWLSKDPIEEEGGLGLYAFVGNDSIVLFDLLGCKWTISRNGWGRAIVKKDQAKDRISHLANRIGMDPKEAFGNNGWFRKHFNFLIQLIFNLNEVVTDEESIHVGCEYTIPNHVYYIDMVTWPPSWNFQQLRDLYSLKQAGFLVTTVAYPTDDEFKDIFKMNNLFGVIVLSHGDVEGKDGAIPAGEDGVYRVRPSQLQTNYRLGAIKAVYCWSGAKTAHDDWKKLVGPTGYLYTNPDSIPVKEIKNIPDGFPNVE
jgi:RHS repeat-associated protein